ncbi:MAG: glycine/sarcosine/betaine reductase selenoprotein B family protein [Candidatus Binataceae bacterium]
MKTFAEIERDFVREKVLPDFGFEWFDQPSRVNLLRVPVRQATVALVATAGAYVKSEQTAFALGKQGDASFREILGDRTLGELGLSHPGYDTKRALHDHNVVFPLDRLRELKQAGEIGDIARRHFSFMGFSPDVPLLMENAREVARRLVADRIDLVLLVPA